MKEKAIEYFKFHRKIFCEDHLKICPKDSIAYQATLKEKEFYDMAIKALEQEPCEDCVSRQAVRDAIMKHETMSEDTMDGYIDSTIELDVEIDSLPPVTPTRKKGEWCKQNDDYFDWYECSECGYGSEGEMQYSSECDVRTKYCPNCGAEMESEE